MKLSERGWREERGEDRPVGTTERVDRDDGEEKGGGCR